MRWYVKTKELRAMYDISPLPNSLLCFSISASFMLLAFFSLQVYMVTKFPFKARYFWTHKRTALCCVGIWLLAFPLDIFNDLNLLHLPNLWWIVRAVVWCIIVIIQIVLKIFSFWEIFKTRRKSGQSQSSKHRQITTTVMIMVVIQMFTALPFVVLSQLQYEVFSLNYHLLLKIITYQSPLACLNFCVNPIIYFVRLPDYRSSLLSLCRCSKSKNQTSSYPQRNKQRELALHKVPPATPQPPS